MHPHLHSPRRGLPGNSSCPASLPVSHVRSCDQPHSVTRGGSWIYLMLLLCLFCFGCLAGWELVFFYGFETGPPRSFGLWWSWLEFRRVLFRSSLSVCEQVFFFCCETGQPQSVSLAAILIYRACGAFSLRGSTRVYDEQQAASSEGSRTMSCFLVIMWARVPGNWM